MRPSPSTSGGSCPRLLGAGANILGGCCGTTPAHIAAMGAALDALRVAEARRAQARAGGLSAAIEVPAGGPGRTARRQPSPGPARGPPSPRRRGRAQNRTPTTRLGQALVAGRFVVSVEIDPPRSIRIERTLDAARLLRDAGTDVVNISDSAMARVRMGAMAVAFGIQHDLDLECVVHVTTRDRNLMGSRPSCSAPTRSTCATSSR